MSRLFPWAMAALLGIVAPTVSEAAFLQYVATLSGPTINPVSTSAGTGTVILGIDTDAHTLRLQVTFRDLLGPAVNAVIHGPTVIPGTGRAGNITPTNFPNFPLGGTSGSYDNTFSTLDDSFYSVGFETANGGTAAGAEAAFLSGLAAGRVYFDIHTTTTPNIEIGGFFYASAVPEPASLVLLTIPLIAAGCSRLHRVARRRKGQDARSIVRD